MCRYLLKDFCHYYLALSLFFLITSNSYASSWTISSNPSHLVIEEGDVGSSTISWSVSGFDSAQVWVSVNGNTESLLATATQGSVDCPWILPGNYYVFLLYEGTSHSTLLDWKSVTTQFGSSSTLGFNYWPGDLKCQSLNNANWTTIRSRVESDLDHMASLNVGIIRLMFWPQLSGFKLYPWGGGFISEFYEQKTNLIDFLSLCQARKIKVNITFGNNFYTAGNGNPDHRWWMDAYSDFNTFLNDTVFWINGFVNSVESSPYSETVIMYDYENEWHSEAINSGWYIREIYDRTKVPKGKRGCSILRIPTGANDLHNELSINIDPDIGKRNLDYVDFHSYPYYPAHADIELAYEQLQNIFPNSTVLMGEFGHPCQSSSYESSQENIIMDLMNRSINKNISYYMNWCFHDSDISGGDGWAYTFDEPKDVMGAASELFSPILNPDMENLLNDKPENWTTGEAIGVDFLYNSEAATGSFCARLRSKQISGKACISSEPVTIEGGRKLFLNCFVRSSMENIHMAVEEYDNSMNLLAKSEGPEFTPTTWKWYNYLQNAGSFNLNLYPETKYIIVSVKADYSTTSSYLDIDTVSTSVSNQNAIRADFNDDGAVNIIDLQAFSASWLTQKGHPDWKSKFNLSSIDNDTIDFLDFSTFVQFWNSQKH